MDQTFHTPLWEWRWTILKKVCSGVLTLAIVLPQLLDVTYTGSLADPAGLEWVIFVGAVWAALGAGATVFLPSSEELEYRKRNSASV